MGNCISASCADRENEGIEKKEESEEIEETPVVEIQINCPTNTGPEESPLEFTQDSDPTAAAVSSSVEVLDIESDEQSLSDPSSFLSEDECDDHPQELQEDFSFEIRGKSCLPRNMKITRLGAGQQNYVHSSGLAPVESPACSSSKNNCQLPQGESSNWAKGRPGPSGLHSTPNISLPPPRPSQWQQLYSQELKDKEQLADKKLKRKLQGHGKVRSKSLRIIKKIKKSMRQKAAQDPNSGPADLPPDETFAAMFGVTVEECRDSSTNNSPSNSRASSRLSSSASRHSSHSNDLEEDSLESENSEKQSGRKSRRWFRLKNNKVIPL